MSDDFFDKEVSSGAAGKKEENESVNIDSKLDNTDETLGNFNTTNMKDTGSEPGIFERNSRVSTDNNQMNGSYSFWAEQIASADNTKDDPKQNPFYRNYMDEQSKKSGQSGDYAGRTDYTASPDNKNTKKKGPVRKIGKFIISAAVFGIVAGTAFIGLNTIMYKINPDAVPIAFHIGGGSGNNGFIISPSLDKNKQLATTNVSQTAIEQKTDITNVVDKTMSSIVTISATYTKSYYDWFGQQVDKQNEGGGSGIIVSKNDKELLIATNNHVVEGASPIKVKFIDGTEAEAIIKGTDASADLAVISIDLTTIKADTLKNITVAKLGDSDQVKVGQMAVAIGNALGYGQSTTVGYISAKDREVHLDDKTMVLLQTDAAINPGNSGGALLNLNGEVIGINTVKYASSEVEGMGFAIPISKAIPIIDELMKREVIKDSEKGYLGVSYSDVTEQIANMYNWPIGVYVKEAVKDGSAEKAGIMTGDIITKVNDTEITAGTQLKEKITSYRAGTDVKVTIMRGSNGKFEEKEITVTLGKASEIPTQQQTQPENSQDNSQGNSQDSSQDNSQDNSQGNN